LGNSRNQSLRCDPLCPLCEAFFAAKVRGMKKIISTTEAPAAIGPYSQAVRAGSLVFCAGQVPLDPKTGQIVSEDIAEQTKRVLDSVTAILRAEQLTLANVVKTTVFLSDFGDFQKMNEVYATYFTENPPARSTVGVSTLPKNARVEIEAIAFDDSQPGGGKTASDTSG
jgi:2-iminobutanoate/2-iminopropanoate deaminase